MNVFQERILEHVATFADDHPCIKAIYIFGSVARGETAGALDIDLSVEYLPNVQSDRLLGESYMKFQPCWEDWALEITDVIGRPVRWSHIYLDDRNDAVWDAIVAASRNPMASMRRAVMVATPRIKK